MNRLCRVYRPVVLGLGLFFWLTAFAGASPTSPKSLPTEPPAKQIRSASAKSSAKPSADAGVRWNGQYIEVPVHFKLRNSVAAEQPKQLSSTPEEHGKDFIQWQHKEGQRAWFYTDYHAVFPLPVENFIRVLKDAENEDQVFPNMIHTNNISPQPSPDKPAYQEVKTSFKILGIGEVYHYVVYRIPSWYSDGGFSVHWALAESLDNKYADLYGSWYVKGFEEESKKYTYVRNYVETEMIEPPPLLKTIQNLFAKRTVKKFFSSLYEAAKAQQGN